MTYNLNRHRVTDHATMPRDEEGESGAAFYQFYGTKDGKFLLFCAIEPKFWRNVCNGIERPDLIERLNTAGPVDFGGGQLELRRELQSIFATRDLTDWVAFAVERDVPMGPANHLSDLLDDPHLKKRNILVEAEHPRAGAFTYVGEAVRVEGQPYEVRRPAPLLGEHTDELLAELGKPADVIADLRERKVV